MAVLAGSHFIFAWDVEWDKIDLFRRNFHIASKILT